MDRSPLTGLGDFAKALIEKSDSLEQKGSRILNQALSKVGLQLETITNREALSLLAMMTNSSSEIERQQFYDLYNAISMISVVEGKEDDISKTLEQDQLRPSNILSMIKRDIQERPNQFAVVDTNNLVTR